MMVPALALSLGACKKKEEPKAPEVSVPVTAEPAVPAPPPAPPVQTTTLSAEERAAKLGFVKHLPQDTEVVIAFHNGSKTVQRLQSSMLWKLMGMESPPDAEFEMEEGFEIQEFEQNAEIDAAAAPDDAEPTGPAALFGTEFTIALGKSTGEQTANLLTLNRRSTYYQMRALATAFADAAADGDLNDMADGLGETFGQEMLEKLLTDPESGVALFEKMHMPPLYLAFRTSASGRDAAAQQLAALTENLAMFGDMVEPVEIERADRKFAGHKIKGAAISDSMAENRKEMEESLDPAVVDRLLAAITKKDLVVLSGTLGDYVMLFFGSSVDDLQFAPDVRRSLVATEALAFSDTYASKELAALIYGAEDALDRMIASVGGLSEIASGLRDGLSGSTGLGDTRDLETLLRMVAEREASLRTLSGNESLGTAAFFEDGLKIESYGGTDNGMIDWKSPNQLASLGDSENVAIFANMTTEAAYDEKARAYVEALMETTYAAAMKIAELPIDAPQMAQFKEMAGIFDTKFRPDLVTLWDFFSKDFSGSLGSERAWVVDLSGSVPAIPGIPSTVVDEAKFPRISMVAPVTDRTKLAASWGKMNTSLTGVLAKVSEMLDQEIPMQKPISSEKDGYTTWFFSLPFFNDDFMPSVTVGDQWFAASTSKNQALDLVNQAASASKTRTGLYFSVNFKALEKFSQETFKVLEENSDKLGISPSDIKTVGQFTGPMEDLDRFTVHVRREDGVLRSSIHLKTR